LLPADYKEQRMVYHFTFEVIDWWSGKNNGLPIFLKRIGWSGKRNYGCQCTWKALNSK
jgi:hypothetical protein